MEIWGGIECTINRVGDQYFDQLTYQGHYARSGDLKLLADLGIKKASLSDPVGKAFAAGGCSDKMGFRLGAGEFPAA